MYISLNNQLFSKTPKTRPSYLQNENLAYIKKSCRSRYRYSREKTQTFKNTFIFEKTNILQYHFTDNEVSC